MSLIRVLLSSIGTAAAALAIAAPAWGQMKAMSEQELSATHGAGILELTNSSYNNLDFTRIALGADINLNANLRNIRLGEYNAGADIDIPLFQFGRSDGTEADRLVKITNPYFEFVYRNAGDAANREVVGMRLGFESIAGSVGLNMKTLTGSMEVKDSAGNVVLATPAGGAQRWDGSCVGACLNFSQLGGVQAGDANGPSRDFWISVLKQDVQFQAPAGMALPEIAKAGFSMNWRDRLTAIAGATPPNLPPVR